MAARVDLDGRPIEPMTICMIGAGGFIGSHLCEELMFKTQHSVLAVDVYDDKIRHLTEPENGHPWSSRIEFHRLNIKHDSRLEGLIKKSDLVSPPTSVSSSLPDLGHHLPFSFLDYFICPRQVINLAAICTPADYNTRPLDTIFSNFVDALPVV